MGIVFGISGFSGGGSAKDGKVEGVGTIQGGVFDKLELDGICTVEGDLKAETLKINGVCSCNGNVEAETFVCDGVMTINGNLRAGTVDIDGVVTVNGSKIEADRIDCEGLLSVDGEISADVIDADGMLNAKEIVGDRIRIKSYWKKGPVALLIGIGVKKYMKYSVIDLIEGTTVELRNVRAKSVNGHDVTIGKDCDIDRIEASGEISIHPSSKVAEGANA